MKKALAILLSVLLLMACVPLSAIPVMAATSGTTGDCTWVLDGTHLTISGNGAMGDYGSYYSRSPWGTSIQSVTIGDGVTTIGKYAFWYCTSLTSVTISDSVTTIGEYAFLYCTSLTSVTIGDSVTTIGDYAFEYCTSLTSVTIPDSVTSIGWGAFYNCSSLTSVTIPDSVTTIGRHAFSSCDSLTSVTIGDSVTTIGYDAFSYCTSLTSVTIGNSVTTIGNGAFYNCSSLTSVTIPDSVTTIWNGAFYNCTSLTSMTIGDSVIIIEDYSFSDCTSLTSVTIGDSVTSIGEDAFYDCTSLTDVYYAGSEEDRSKISIGSNNSDLTSATWHYNYVAVCVHVYDNDADPDCNVCGAVRAVADRVGMSVSEDVSGLAMQFRPEVEGIAEKSGAYMQADYTNATYHGYKLIEMGVVASNGVCETTIKGEYMYEWKDGMPTFAFRIINIPTDKLDVVITMTPYYVVEIDGVATIIYGTAQTGAYSDVAN